MYLSAPDLERNYLAESYDSGESVEVTLGAHGGRHSRLLKFLEPELGTGVELYVWLVYI